VERYKLKKIKGASGYVKSVCWFRKL